MALGKFLQGRIPLFLSNSIKTNAKFPFLENVLTNFLQVKRTCTTDEKKEKNTKAFRHGYPEELEGAVNNQILRELNASMVYLSMYCYYGRTDIALPGCQSFFKGMYDEEQEHALGFINYQLIRGGQVQLFPTTVPEDMNWTDITVALGVALELEKRIKEKLEELARLAECHKDLQLADFVISKYLDEQNKSICEMGRLLTKAKRLVDTGGVGRHLFDKEVLKYVNKKHPEIKLTYENI